MSEYAVRVAPTNSKAERVRKFNVRGVILEMDNLDFILKSLQKIIGRNISEKEQKKLAGILKPVKLNKGQYWLKAGEKSEVIAFNISGLLRFFYIDMDGNDVTKYFCLENSIILTSAALTNKESAYYIEALEDCVLMTADYLAFTELTKDSAFWLEIIKNEYEKALIYKEERERSFLLENATERYKNFIKDYPNTDKRIKLKYIASYLGISPVSLSRIRKKLTFVNDN